MTDRDTPATRRHRRKRVRRLLIVVGQPTARTIEPVPTGNRHHHARRRSITVAFELLTTQQVPLTLQAEDAAGKVVTDPGTRTWASTDETVVTVSAPDSDGNVIVVAAGAAGTATVTVSDVEPDTNAGPGATFVGSLDFIVSAPADPITQIVLVPGTPVDKPTA